MKVLGGLVSQESVPPAARVSAAGILLDRGWGKALQPHGGEDGSSIQIIIREILDIGKEEPRLIKHADGATRLTGSKVWTMTEYIPTPEDNELEATIGRLFDRLEEAREGSAEYRINVRQLRGLRKGEIKGLIFEEFTIRRASLP